MTKFSVGDRVQMSHVPIVVEVLEFGTCDVEDCRSGREIFRFKDPETGEDDWMHVSEFKKVTT